MTQITVNRKGLIIVGLIGLVVLAFFLIRGIVYGRSDFLNNCTEAKVRHLTNIPRSSVYYREQLDRDHNGIACQV